MDSSDSTSSSSSSSSTSFSSSGVKILVSVLLDARVSSQLLSWAVRAVAHENDTVIALHDLVGKEERRLNHDMNRFRPAKAFVISMLEEFVEMCQAKQLKLEAKVRSSPSIGKGMADEAARLKANFLFVGGPRKLSQRSGINHLGGRALNKPDYYEM